jgi:hypothetical protein
MIEPHFSNGILPAQSSWTSSPSNRWLTCSSASPDTPGWILGARVNSHVSIHVALYICYLNDWCFQFLILLCTNTIGTSTKIHSKSGFHIFPSVPNNKHFICLEILFFLTVAALQRVQIMVASSGIVSPDGHHKLRRHVPACSGIAEHLLQVSIYRNHPHTVDCLIQRSPSYSWLFSWAKHVAWMLIFSFHMLFADATPLDNNCSFQFDKPDFFSYSTHASDAMPKNAAHTISFFHFLHLLYMNLRFIRIYVTCLLTTTKNKWT